uniref:Uncharacterized protein n=1 Tax=Glossina palpalis gambiensis TaxID=67801 RepID=A0A1B0C0R8_9MUSC
MIVALVMLLFATSFIGVDDCCFRVWSSIKCFFVLFTLSWNLSGSVTTPPRNKEAIELREPFSKQTSRILSLATHDSRLLPNIVILEPDPNYLEYLRYVLDVEKFAYLNTMNVVCVLHEIVGVDFFFFNALEFLINCVEFSDDERKLKDEVALSFDVVYCLEAVNVAGAAPVL